MTVDFGYVVNLGSNSPEGGPTLVDDNRRVLRSLAGPVNTLWLEDHFQFGETPLLECWTALSMFAGEFPTLRLGTIVMSQSYRNPAALAKMAAVLQFMSGGRLIFGIGAGWKEDEYRAYGYPYPTPAVRIAQLDEAVQIAKKMWTETPATFEGKHYSIHNAICTPRPSPIPPILIGGGGEQLTMRVVARHADWWNVGFRNVADYGKKVEVLKEHCARIGRDFSTLTLSYYAQLQVSRDASRIKKHDRLYQVGGTPDQVAAELQQFIDLGVKHIMVRPSDFPSLESIETLQQDVIPRLRLDGK